MTYFNIFLIITGYLFVITTVISFYYSFMMIVVQFMEVPMEKNDQQKSEEENQEKKIKDYSEPRRKLLDEYLSKKHNEVPSYQDMANYLSDHNELNRFVPDKGISKSTISRDLNALGYKKEGSTWIKEKDSIIKKLKRGYKDYLIGKFSTYSLTKSFAIKLRNLYRKNEKVEGIGERTRLLVYSLTLLIEPGYEGAIGQMIYETYSYDKKSLSVFPGIGCVKIETTSAKLYKEINSTAIVSSKKK